MKQLYILFCVMLPVINIIPIRIIHIGRQNDSVVKNLPANAGDMGLIPGSGRSLGEETGSPPQSCLGNGMDRGAWWATVHGVSKELNVT